MRCRRSRNQATPVRQRVKALGDKQPLARATDTWKNKGASSSLKLGRGTSLHLQLLIRASCAARGREVAAGKAEGLLELVGPKQDVVVGNHSLLRDLLPRHVCCVTGTAWQDAW